MATAGEIHVKGLRELDELLKTLPIRMQKNIMRGALRAGMNRVKPQAQGNIRSRSGDLARGLRVGTKMRGQLIQSRLLATGHHRSIAHLVEFGTRPHMIRPKNPSGLLFFGGRYYTSVNHPGARPYPFMRPALDSAASQAVSAVAAYIRERLATKHGMNVAHIPAEGDE